MQRLLIVAVLSLGIGCAARKEQTGPAPVPPPPGASVTDDSPASKTPEAPAPESPPPADAPMEEAREKADAEPGTFGGLADEQGCDEDCAAACEKYGDASKSACVAAWSKGCFADVLPKGLDCENFGAPVAPPKPAKKSKPESRARSASPSGSVAQPAPKAPPKAESQDPSALPVMFGD